MLVQAAQAVFLPHPRNCEVVSHPVKLWKGVVPRTLMDRDWGRWYGLECHGNFFQYQSLPTVLIGQGSRKTGLPKPQHHCPPCEHRLLYDPALRHVQDAGGSWCLPRNGCTAEVLRGHNACWRAQSRSGSSKETFRPCPPCRYVC